MKPTYQKEGSADKLPVKNRDQLYQAQKMEALGTLVAGMAHEINNPINMITINMPIIKRAWHDFMPVLKEYAEKNPEKRYGGLPYEFIEDNFMQLISDVDMAANRIAGIVSDLKNFARQSYAADKGPVQINVAVENAVRLVKTFIKESRIRLEMDIEDDLPQIEGNLNNIEQIILNIIVNAAEAIEDNCASGRIGIKTGFRKKDGDVYISISDNGKGVDPAISDRIFDPFVTDKHDGSGTGLGLSVIYSIVEAHNGKITFNSKKDHGTVFTVSFPAKIAKYAAKILIVDDEESVRFILKEFFANKRAYLVDEASNGIEACIKLGTYRPDILILDIFMPEMDGVEVCRTIREDPDLSDIKVIITTGNVDHPKIDDVKNLGFNNIYSKPVRVKDLLMEVDRLLLNI